MKQISNKENKKIPGFFRNRPAKGNVVGMKRICMLLFFALVLSAPFAGHACGETLTLPAGVKAVQEEAFYQDAAIGKSILPDGFTSLGMIPSRTTQS